MPRPLALDAYEALADSYAARIDTKPHNAYYERPAMLSLLPVVAGLDVLDAGCGPGVYTEWLVRHGARVVAVDASPRMLAHARARVPSGAEFHQADLAGDLAFLADDSFDLVIAPLVMDYLPDWHQVFTRLHRALKPGALLVFSAGHPFFEAVYFRTERYFAVEQVRCNWTSFDLPIEMPSYRRPLAAAINSVIDAGFELVQLLEPLPTEEFERVDPVRYRRLTQQPSFICIKARKRAER